MDSPKLSAILLAAGSSTRMGEANKLLLPFRQGVIIQHLIRELAAAKIDELIIVLGYEASEVKTKIPQDIVTVFNENYRSGMTSSIQAGVRMANPEHQGIMICLADQVMMQTADYNHLITEWNILITDDSESIVVPVFEKQRGNPVIFSTTYREKILHHKAPNGCKEIVQQHRQHLRQVNMPNDHVLIDVDNESDYERIVGL